MKHIDELDLVKLAERLGPLHAKQRLGIEIEREAQINGQGINLFNLRNWSSHPSLIELLLKVGRMYKRGVRNACHVSLRRNELYFEDLPPSFDGFTILQISDLHVEMSEYAMQGVCEQVSQLDYDICVLTGDFRAGYGSFQLTLEGMAKVRDVLHEPLYGVLGNHDTIRMVPGLEAMGIRMLLNESVSISRGSQAIFVAGIDDAHYYRVDNFEKAVSQIPEKAFSVLLSHTPEVYRQAAHAGFKLLLSGHTHGGQICLPGGIPITLDSVLPRRMGAGAWQYGSMYGYTSVGAGTCIVPVRFNCPPEITLHILRCSRSASTARREYEPSKAMETK
jgi:predicted MPP superfamily phosphohydrolase